MRRFASYQQKKVALSASHYKRVVKLRRYSALFTRNATYYVHTNSINPTTLDKKCRLATSIYLSAFSTAQKKWTSN